MKEAFNPLRATKEVQESYFRFFQSSFAPNNQDLSKEFEFLKNKSYMWKNPYISISLPFEEGMLFKDFARANGLAQVLIDNFHAIKKLYTHQEIGIRAILENKSTIVSSGTGSGKTEIFIVPLLDFLIKNTEKPGVKAIIIYPMNALVNDQVERLRKILYPINQVLKKKITFASYTGNTLTSPKEVEKERIAELCPEPDCGKNLIPKVSDNCSYMQCEKNPQILIDYQVLSREEIRKNPPDILITNYVELEYLLSRKNDSPIFDTGFLRYIVLDEIHTYAGARGIDVAFLLRRLKRRANPNGDNELIFIGTSATLSTKKGDITRKKEVAGFASKIFGTNLNEDNIVEGKYEKWHFDKVSTLDRLEKIPLDSEIESAEQLDSDLFVDVCKKIIPQFSQLSNINSKSMFLGKALFENPFFQEILKILQKPRDISEIINLLSQLDIVKKNKSAITKSDLEHLVWDYLKLGSLAAHPFLSTSENLVPLTRVNLHNFFRTVDNIYVCHKCKRLYTSQRDTCETCNGAVDRLGVCRFCGKEYYISIVSEKDIHEIRKQAHDSIICSSIGKDIDETRIPRLSSDSQNSVGSKKLWQTFHSIDTSDKSETIFPRKKCIDCGAINLVSDDKCFFCNSPNIKPVWLLIKESKPNEQTHLCPFCGNSYGRASALSPISMNSNTASTTLFDMIYACLPEEYRKLLIFTDNKQAASYLAGYLELEHRTHTICKLIFRSIKDEFNGRAHYSEVKEAVVGKFREWYGGDFEGFYVKEEDVYSDFIKEIASVRKQRSLEKLGIIEINYDGLENNQRFNLDISLFRKNYQNAPAVIFEDIATFRKYLISILDMIRQDGAIRGLETKRYNDQQKATGYLLRFANQKSKFIRLKSFLSPRSTVFAFSKKTYHVDKPTLEKIITFAFEYLTRKNFLVHATISKYRESAQAYIVQSSKIILRFPQKISRCNRCLHVYANSPNNVCLKWLCQGKTTNIDYLEYINSQKLNHYFRLYTEEEPVRMVTNEDTGAVELRERRRVETEFKSNNSQERKIDVVVATPTLELGVDIGDLLSIGLFKAPPSPVSYTQRIGRAGRRERISFNNTFFFLSPIDQYYFDRPSELIQGEVSAPIINTTNMHMFRRHVNALIVEDLFVNSDISSKIRQNMGTFTKEQNINQIKNEFSKRKIIIHTKIRAAFNDITVRMTDQEISSLSDGFISDFDHSVKNWFDEVNRYINYSKELSQQLRGKSYSEQMILERQQERIHQSVQKLEEKLFSQHAMDTGLLPRYAFPGMYVDIEDEFGKEQFGGQNRNYAISEYAPGKEVTLKKRIYESIGVDFRFSKPKQTTFYVCKNCLTYIADKKYEVCPICKKRDAPKEYFSIAPETLFLKKSSKTINELRENRQTITDIYVKSQLDKPIKNRLIDNIELIKYGNVEIIQIVSGLQYEEEKDIGPRSIELCEICGRQRRSAETVHYELGSNKKCAGRYKAYNLFHGMPTNVVSLKIRNNSLFDILIPGIEPEAKIFLTTLKNALLNAAQILFHAEEGEIDGAVKNQEILFFDNVEGGVGYVYELFERFDEVLRLAADIVLNPEDDCEKGCPKCLYSYRRKLDISKKLIDKRVIKPLLEQVRLKYANVSIEQKGEKTTYQGNKIISIHSPDYDLTGVIELKNILRSSSEEVKLSSLYVTDDKIDWPDEGTRSWVDIFSSLKLDHAKKVKITIIVREPRSDSHKRALRRLMDVGVDVLVFKKELESRFPAIAHEKLVVIDPQNPKSRYAVHTSGNFSLEMWKNRDVYDFGTDEEWVRGTNLEILRLEKESRKLTEKDVMTENGQLSFPVLPGTQSKEIEQLVFELSKAKEELCIMDPYLNKIEEILAFLSKWITKSVIIKIITARTESKKLNEFIALYKGKGRRIEVLRYFDRSRVSGKETILHDRYLISDRKTVLRLGKGLNTFIENNDYTAKDNVVFDVITAPPSVDKYKKNFDEFWNYETSTNKTIRAFPKEAFK